ncbi:hypothetical protein [Spirosoma sp. KNUC1025]|uniref:hypothetical protein n=1 Tax=Spirosoma sp. KNUC1025 TaxID=2894082 RepID=UPI003864762C|nr:hypothetical protein LN737_02705 [Spirosoma sp. KNUC1025]
MKTSRRNALKWMGGSLAATLTPFLSYSRSTHSTAFTGEDMYRGIFFGEGEFANLIPEMKSLKAAYPQKHQTTEQLNHATEVRRHIIQAIKEKDALFFDQFKASMTSQNVFTIKRSLLTASANTSAAVEALYGPAGKASGNYRYEKRSGNTGMGTVLLVENAVACINVIYILAAAIIVSSGHDEEELVSTKNSSSLLIEQIAASVCKATRTMA